MSGTRDDTARKGNGMRFRSRQAAGGQVFAVSGVNTVSFAILAGDSTKDGLLGFAVERTDKATGRQQFMPGFKVFASLIPEPQEGLRVSTFDHPVQSFVWDDFTAQPDNEYAYRFHPIKGRPGDLDRGSRPLSIRVRTEPLVSSSAHDVFFNRGVASSQAYQRRFGTAAIETLEPQRRAEALAWLSRDLDEAILRFIDSSQPGDLLLGCFYEFRYPPVAAAFKAAIGRGVDVRIIVDAKVNERTDGDGDFFESFPREENLRLIAASGIGDHVRLRQARQSNIQHNKFLVRLTGGNQPTEVWTGSTNLSTGGIHGQTNVGHWLRDAAIATQFVRYWELLAQDPGGMVSDSPTVKARKNKAFKSEVQRLSPVPADLTKVLPGATAVFSPRPGKTVLDSYAQLLDSAQHEACITLAFGVGQVFKDVLRDNTPRDHLVFMLLEKKDAPRPGSTASFVRINASNNVYKAWGSFLRSPVYQWALETNALQLGLNKHVSYIHSKFMLIDPLSADSIVVTGSANFSPPSTDQNDENMLIIRGDHRVSDIYFTEFNRLFNHYYFRSITELLRRTRQRRQASLFLAETAAWQAKYARGTFRAKRLKLYEAMAGFRTL